MAFKIGDLVKRKVEELRGSIVLEGKRNKYSYTKNVYLVRYNKHKEQWLNEEEIELVKI